MEVEEKVAEPVTLLDLTKYKTHDRHVEDRWDQTGFLAIKTDRPDDIYQILNIDPNSFSIFVEVKDIYRGIRGWKVTDVPEAVFRADMDLFVYVEKRPKDGRYNSDLTTIKGKVQLILPGVYKPNSFVFYDRDRNLVNRRQHLATLSLNDGGDNSIYISSALEIAESVFGLTFSAEGVGCMGGVFNTPILDSLYQTYKREPISFSLGTLFDLKGRIQSEPNCRFLLGILKNREGMTGASILVPQGNKKVIDQVIPFYEKLLEQDEVFLIATFHTLVFECKKTINGVKVAKWFNEFFADAKSLETFKTKLEQVFSIFIEYESSMTYRRYQFEELFVKLPGYTELRKSAIRSQSGRAISKMVSEIESLNLDEQKYPVLVGLIRDGSIPVSTFFRKEGDEAYFLFNSNWGLFEEFLKHYQEVGIELAKLASQRTTYEKSFMSYMYFVLYELPEYLEKHTGRHWKCIPSIVDSANELEPQVGGTTKKRSALTPIVDNEALTVTVPYACLNVPGYTTTYTYSLNYSIIRRGLSIEGDVATSDIEEKLNGRDDYGLMFYTLTGSVQGRGYPSFLIIFERLEEGITHVHFHRTHPLRSKDGDKNPVNNWIRTCYNWMIGNVNLVGLKVQQGDLAFVAISSLPEGEWSMVNSFDSHEFSVPVSYSPYTKKDSQNILGYFNITEDTLLNHPHHRNRIIPKGFYELRQCRSWEANPKGIWTLRID